MNVWKNLLQTAEYYFFYFSFFGYGYFGYAKTSFKPVLTAM